MCPCVCVCVTGENGVSGPGVVREALLCAPGPGEASPAGGEMEPDMSSCWEKSPRRLTVHLWSTSQGLEEWRTPLHE